MKLAAEYRKALEPWIRASQKYLYKPESHSGMKFYGEGTGQHWALQTNNNAFAAYAVLAADPDTDYRIIGSSRDELVGNALGMLRYTLSTHQSGPLSTIDGRKWGHNWISPLCIERMVHGIEAMDEFLTSKDRTNWLRVLASESEWLVEQYEIQAGIGELSNKLTAHKFYFQDDLHTVDKHSPNKPENNIWSGCLLYRASLLIFDEKIKSKYLERARQFLLNGISVPSDAKSDRLYGGRPLSQWHIGSNFLEPSYSLNHHGYLNVGYMVICLSNIGMLHFTLKRLGIDPPEELYLHMEDLWAVVKKFIFKDGRLIRTGGATRARYTYCQEYLIPSWLMVLDKIGDPDVEEMEANWLSIVNHEAGHNGDGSFYSDRLALLEERSPYYYTRLEADRAGTLAFGAFWRRVFDDFKDIKQQKEPSGFYGDWNEAFHGAAFTRSPKRIASWTWMAGQKPTGIVVPGERSDMAEWDRNLVGRIEGLGYRQVNKIAGHKETVFANGFLSFGEVHHHDTDFAGEVEPAFRLTAKQKIVFAVLPDDATVIGMQYACAGDFVWIKNVQGLMLLMPNDVMNDFNRSYYTKGNEYKASGFPDEPTAIKTLSRWLNVDDCLAVYSIYGGSGLTINRPIERQLMIDHHSHSLPNLYADEICAYFNTEKRRAEKDTPLLDCGYVLQTGIDRTRTAANWESGKFTTLESLGEMIRAISVMGEDDRRYILISNFSEKIGKISYAVPGERILSAQVLGTRKIIDASNGIVEIDVPAGESVLLKLYE
jgi:hypothetical protein